MAIFKRLNTILHRHWSERKSYQTRRDWFMSIYNRMLVHLPRWPLPGRARVRGVRPAGVGRPLLVRLGTSDWYCLEEVFLGGEQDVVVRELGGARAAGVKTIVDLGANVGMTLRLWRAAFPNARIVAVEPDPGNIAMAARNLAEADGANGSNGAGVGAGVTLIEACVTAQPRGVYLDRSLSEYAFRTTDRPTGQRIEGVTVPQILERAGVEGAIDLLKCDIEGAEAEVFGDCGGWIGRVRHLMVEVHAPYTLEALRRDLERVGVRVEVRHAEEKGAFAVAFLKLGGDA